MARPEQPEPFLRGCPWPAGAGVSYPRADPRDFTRLPIDTWGCAQLPVSVRLEFVGDAREVSIGYRTETDDLGYRGDGAGRSFTLWRQGVLVDEAAAVLGEGNVTLRCGSGDARAIVYLPEGMKPTVVAVEGAGGSIAPAPPQPRWIAYGDSVAEGWIASGPSGAWPAIAGRTYELDVCNLGYAGSARGELASAEQIATLAGDVISITHGTNCWTRIPHSFDMMLAVTRAFLDLVRQGHPTTPMVVVSPVVRPDAEQTPNRLGAALPDLRRAMQEAALERIDKGDSRLWFVDGTDLMTPDLLGDGIHPGDAGHEVLAAKIGSQVKEALWSS
jgi:lysophospholipase L1-like esterase